MGRFDHVNREDVVMQTERRIVGKYNRVMFGIGILCAIVIPPLIYRWKRGSMEVFFV